MNLFTLKRTLNNFLSFLWIALKLKSVCYNRPSKHLWIVLTENPLIDFLSPRLYGLYDHVSAMREPSKL
ncbi:MAG: hypothetical protein HOB45_13500 [Planctomycetaceae bacterium]|nr:hypothetical protein [Planctomycetaceae bacterium]